MAEEKKTTKPKSKGKPRRPRPPHAVEITVWSTNGGPLPESAVTAMEEAIQAVQVEQFNGGIRLLTQTTRG